MKKTLKYTLLPLGIVLLVLICVICTKNSIVEFYNSKKLEVINNKQDKASNEILKEELIPNWNLDSKTMKSIVSFVQNATNPNSIEYIPVEQRIAIFDFDGTLYGEHFPTYFDLSMLIYRLLYDKSYNATEEQIAYAKALERTYFDNEPWVEYTKTEKQIAAESFQNFTVEDYREYVRKFMSYPVIGFEGMTYSE